MCVPKVAQSVKKQSDNGVLMNVRKRKSESNYDVFSTIFSLTFIGVHLRKYRSNTKFSDSEWINGVLLRTFFNIFDLQS